MPVVGTAEWWTFVSGIGILVVSVAVIMGYAALHTVMGRHRRLFMLHELAGPEREAAEQAFARLPDCRTRWLQHVDYRAGRSRVLRRLNRLGAESVIVPPAELVAHLDGNWHIAFRRQGNGACTVFWDRRHGGLLLFRAPGNIGDVRL